MRSLLAVFSLCLLTPMIRAEGAATNGTNAATASLPLLSPLFSDHMVLQREQPVPVWGWASPGEEVIVGFAGLKKTGRADASGKWMVRLDPMPASAESRDLTVEAGPGHDKVILHDVLVGDVWLCTGQSNMGFTLSGALNGSQEIAAADHPMIRLFSVADNPSLTPVDTVKGSWRLCSPQTAGGFSAVAYFFGRELERDLKIPVGLLLSSVGGTPAEAWTRLEKLKSVPVLAERAEKEIEVIKQQPGDSERFPAARTAWESKYGVTPPPVAEAAVGWADPALDARDWKPVKLPASWSQLGEKTGGVFWLRKEVTLSPEMAGKPMHLALNWLNEQYDTAYFNGVEVGKANATPPRFYNTQRHYSVPGKLVKAGRNVIALRVVAASPQAAMVIAVNVLELPFTDPAAQDPNWLMKRESSFPPLTAEALAERPKPNTASFICVSAALYNGMIAPLVPFAIKGAIWYQGESNTSRAGEYRQLLSMMITDWREKWGQGNFPFLIQQLVNNGSPCEDPSKPGTWPALREAQEQVSVTLPNCGMATGMELGSAFTIHPPNKQDVGKRLALVALEKVYGKPVESAGPRYESMKIDGSAIRVKFTHARGLLSKDGPPKTFVIAGSDQKFYWADAKIEGDTIVVSSPQVPQPVAVRYAWATNPEGCNVYNDSGLPMAPFRTDDWKLPEK